MAAPAALVALIMSRTGRMASRPPEDLPPEMPENPSLGADTPDSTPREPEPLIVPPDDQA